MNTAIHEIAPDLFRLSVYVPDFDMQFNHFLVRDDEPLLFHTGLKSMFPALREAVATLIDPATLRHIAWSHFEFPACRGQTKVMQRTAAPLCSRLNLIVALPRVSHE